MASSRNPAIEVPRSSSGPLVSLMTVVSDLRQQRHNVAIRRQGCPEVKRGIVARVPERHFLMQNQHLERETLEEADGGGRGYGRRKTIRGRTRPRTPAPAAAGRAGAGGRAFVAWLVRRPRAAPPAEVGLRRRKQTCQVFDHWELEVRVFPGVRLHGVTSFNQQVPSIQGRSDGGAREASRAVGEGVEHL